MRARPRYADKAGVPRIVIAFTDNAKLKMMVEMMVAEGEEA
jgi:hypothetical protein